MNPFMDGRVFAGGDAQRVLVIALGLVALDNPPGWQLAWLLVMAWMLRQIREAS